MKKLLIVLAALMMIPTVVLAGNATPVLYLEVQQFADDPSDPGPVPASVCVHERPQTYPWTLPCYAPWVRYNYYVVPLHVGKLDMPICTTTGVPCLNYGGYLGVGFGVQSTGTGTLGFMSWTACPGFLVGPGVAPASCLASSTALCHDWVDHEGYLTYFASSVAGATPRMLNIVASGDLGHFKVINCANQYDAGTTVGGGVQIGGPQTIVCPGSPTPVAPTTWGAIKGLYR